MLSGEESLLRVIDSLYDASTDATRWSAALEQMAGLFDACAMTLLQFTQSGAGAVFASTGISPESGDLYDRYYVGKDLTVKAAMMLPVGTFSGSDRAVSKKEWDRSEMVADLLLPNGLYRIAGSVLLRNESGFASIGMHRPRSAREFDDHDEQIYQVVQPHLQRALEVTRKLGRASEEREALADSLDCLATGVVILDGEGRILLANRTATDLAAAGDGFALTRQGPAAAHSNNTAALRKRIAEAASIDGTSRRDAPGQAVLLERPSGKKSFEALAVPLGRGNSLNGHGCGRVVLFITDPEREASPPTEWLRQLYDLTCAEARLAVALANGASLTEAAEQFHVARNTVRTHLQRAMNKTGTCRQGELIRLVMGGPAGIVDPGSE